MPNYEGITSIVEPETKGFSARNVFDDLGDKLSATYFESIPVYGEMDELGKRMEALHYGDVIKPPYNEENPPTQQTELNRTLLLYAIKTGLEVPEKYKGNADYMTTPTEQMLTEVFDEDELQKFQGVLVFSILDEFGQKGLDRENTLAIGGLTYTQNKVVENGSRLGLYRKITASPAGTKEAIKDILFKDVKGHIHAIPYGETKSIPGKEKETLAMLADDFLQLMEHFETINDDNVENPRFVIGGTNTQMAGAAERYMDAQVGYFKMRGVEGVFEELLGPAKEATLATMGKSNSGEKPKTVL